jgi:integrase
VKGHIRQRHTRTCPKSKDKAATCNNCGGSWEVVIELDRDAEGRRRQKFYTVKGKKGDAQRELRKLLTARDEGSYVEPSKETVGQFLQRWLDGKRQTVSPKTHESYTEIVAKHLTPALGGNLLSKLRPDQIRAYYAEKLASGRRNGRGGLSAKSVTYHHRILRQALQQAVDDDLLARNPADRVKPPKSQERKFKKHLESNEQASLLKAVSDTRLYLPVLLALTTAMRRGEILGLRWEDVDFENSTLSVGRSLEETADGLRLKEPKSDSGRRVISLPALTVEALRQQKRAQAEMKLLLGGGYSDEGLVCCREDGKPWSPDRLTHSFLTASRKAGLKMRFHDLRHTHASQLIDQGENLKVIQERLGHSTPAFTLAVYGHRMEGRDKEAATRIDAALRFALGQ